jgi:hypothetical protein
MRVYKTEASLAVSKFSRYCPSRDFKECIIAGSRPGGIGAVSSYHIIPPAGLQVEGLRAVAPTAIVKLFNCGDLAERASDMTPVLSTLKTLSMITVS